MIALFETGAQIFVFSLAEQRQTQRGDIDKRDIHVDKGVGVRSGLGARDGALVALGAEGVVDLADIERQPAHRAIAGQRHPVRRFLEILVDHQFRAALCGELRQAAKPERPGDLEAGAQDGVVDDHDGDGGAGNDVQLMGAAALHRLLAQIDAGVFGRHRLDLGIRDTDQDDGLGMLDQLHAGDHRIGIDADENIDRLAGIAGGGDEIRGEEHPADGLAALERRHDRNVGAQVAISLGAGNDRGDRNLFEIGGNPDSSRGRVRRARDQGQNNATKPGEQAQAV